MKQKYTKKNNNTLFLFPYTPTPNFLFKEIKFLAQD